MSGGAFNYVCFAEGEDLLNKLEDMEREYNMNAKTASCDRVIFVQISDQLTSADRRCRDYYDIVHTRTYNTTPTEHWMEIPTWIPICCGYINPAYYKRSMYTVTDMLKAVRYFSTQPNAALLFSVMDVNKSIIRKLIGAVSNPVLLGGYIGEEDRKEFTQFSNVSWLESPAELWNYFYRTVEHTPDYSLFHGIKTIPRVTLSRGCKHECVFCSIPRGVTELGQFEVYEQVTEFTRHLEFEYIYIDDKTFGQADNFLWLEHIYSYVQQYNKSFKGFIIQTTVPMAIHLLKKGYVERLHIKSIEVGIEVVDDAYLEKMNKPYRTKQLPVLMAELAKHDVAFVPNILLGFQGDNYCKTLYWLLENQPQIAFINPYILTLYDNAKGSLGYNAEGKYDQDETTAEKSWLDKQAQQKTAEVLEVMLALFEGEVE